MKKIFGITIGGLQSKILNLFLIIFIITIACGSAISVYQSKYLEGVVQSTKEEQQTAIKSVSADTMQQVMDASMTKTNALQAYIADEIFESVKSDVSTLQKLTEDAFANSAVLPRGTVGLPDPKNDGKLTSQLLCEEGVDYTASEYLPVAANMTAAMEAMFTNAIYSANVYMGFEDGTHIVTDITSSDKFDESGRLIPFPVRERPWYQEAKARGELCFTGLETDTYTDNICVTCAAPISVGGKFIGVVGMDIFLNDMSNYVEQSSNNGGFICIVSDQGQVILSPDDNPLFTVGNGGEADDLTKSENRELADFISSALKQSTGLRLLNIDEKNYYMCGSPMDSVGWSVITVVDEETADSPTALMLSEYDRINDKSAASYKDGTKKLMWQTIFVIGMILILGIIASLVFAGKIVKPIESMTAAIIEGSKTGKVFEMKPIYRTKDEIEVLADTFDDLGKKTTKYINDITTITAEKERISTELSLAKQIQAAMLPHIFPPYPDRHEFDIYATMDPAKEVGGDFYDFFLIDDDHLCLVMADVSGKGIPAALFMMIAKTQLHSYAMLGQSAGEILTQTNEALCTNNQVEMFVTVWVGILEISTGRLTAANAGHEYPAIKRRDGKFEIFKDKHGFVVGGMNGTRYKEYELQLEVGDKLFLYTDGVPEATDANENMFGIERMLDALNQTSAGSSKELLNSVSNTISEFVGEAEQFDDLTMLCIEYNGNKKKDEQE
ncbi:MAG: SpoIIE family protein phosphatase [Ruminococcus sp.]|nr:SpoIIE family protein phosphatase [Ruminococcus sp.]